MIKIYTSKTTFDAYTRYPDNYYEVEEYMEKNNMEQKYILFNGALYDRDKDFKIAKVLDHHEFIFCNDLYISSLTTLEDLSNRAHYNPSIKWNDLILFPQLKSFLEVKDSNPKRCNAITGYIATLAEGPFIVDDKYLIYLSDKVSTPDKINITISNEEIVYVVTKKYGKLKLPTPLSLQYIISSIGEEKYA